MTGSRSAAISWLTNPLVILVAAVWGQLDPIATLLALVSVQSYGKNKLYTAYFLASLGAAVKVWPIILVPLFLASSMKREGLRATKPVIAVVPALAATAGLYALFGNLPETLFVFLYARGIPTYAGQFTVNGLTWQQILYVLGSPPVPLFLILGIPLYAFILVHIYRTGDKDITKWVIVSILIFYLTYNYVNPQYFYWTLPFLILQGRRLARWVFTILPMAFVALAYNIFYFVSPTILYDEFSIGQSIVEQLKLAYFYTSLGQYIVLTALIPTLVYLVLLRQQLKRTSHSRSSGG
jgi:Gpi18-like mannosyltransferase